MPKLKFLFGVHCHQPSGNFEHVFNVTYERAYLPFIETLAKHPRIKFAAHYSGFLYDWIIEKHPEFIELLRKLVKRGQLEILSGGHYEPLLAVIPDEDKLGQIEMANQFIKENFLRTPRGMWLAQRVWQPSLARVLSRAGIEFVLLDDDHFIRAGIKPENLSGYYLTEEEGQTVSIFPINRRLREMIPCQSPEKVVAYLKSISPRDGSAAVVYMDNGEKFGLGHETPGEGYLEKLLSLFESNSDWLEFTSFSNYLDEHPSLGRIYLPCGSYSEMMKWSLPANFEGSGNSGYFRNFLLKYPEANNMHKKMLHVSDKLRTLGRGKALTGGHNRSEELKKARVELYKGQCNCAYWHGISGGLYLNHLRHAVYSHLIRSETELEKLKRGSKPYVELSITDFDKDGRDEVLLSNNFLNCYFSPRRGGCLFELDYKPKAFNLINTLARRRENYHDESAVHDPYPRFSLIDHFLASDADLESFSSSNYREAGDFAFEEYSFVPRRSESEAGLRLSRTGWASGAAVKIEKSISLLANQSLFSIEYEVSNQGKEEREFWFGVEFNFNLLSGYSPDRYYVIEDRSLDDRSLASRGKINQVKYVKIVDEWSGFDVSLEISKPALLWRFPIETISGPVTRPDKIYQSCVIFPSWKLRLEPKESWTVKISFRVEE